MWNSFGAPPQTNEIEVTVIGPGYGESVVVHLGNGEWLIADSCIDTLDGNKHVAPLRYLRQLGVPVESAVKFVVASHWDDDHVRGIANVVEACLEARFFCSSIYPDDKFTAFVEAMSIGSAATDGANVREIRRILALLHSRDKPFHRATPGRKLSSSPLIQSWSPSAHDDNEFLMYLSSMHPKAREPLRKAVLGSSNVTSIVLTIDWPDSSVLLGADMESNSNLNRGWDAVLSETKLLGCKKSELVKIPHHGSSTGHHQGMWSDLMRPNPISVIAPFGRGPRQYRPPKASDIRRISSNSGSLFMTANRNKEPTRNAMDLAVKRTLREGMISLNSQKTRLGIVRHRKLGSAGWTHELFGAATRLK